MCLRLLSPQASSQLYLPFSWWEVGSSVGSEFPVLSTWGLYPDHPARAIKNTCQVFSLLLILSLSLLPSVLSCFVLLDTPKPPVEDSFLMPDEFAVPEAEAPGRAKRSHINSNRAGGLNVETLVVADRKMLEKHGRDNVTTYVLTVMNMVSGGRRGYQTNLLP